LNETLRGACREPLVHFLLGGLAIFLFFVWRGTEVDPVSRAIVIEQAQVERLAAQFAQTYRRSPDPDEIDGLIRDYIKEEVYNREARRLGLDADDSVIRQRLRQKMEYLARSSAESQQPGEAELQKQLRANPAKYSAGTVYSFDQVYLGQNVEDDIETRAKATRARLAKGADWRDLGEPLSVPGSMDQAMRSDVERQFGGRFVDGLAALPSGSPDQWRGPITSGFGAHLVRLRKVVTPEVPKLADVRQQVENDWRAETVDAREKEAYQALLDGYTVRIEKP
jgi:hypothetical protein